MNNLYGLFASIIYIFLVIFLSRLFTKAGKEASRKFIHIMLANWWIIAMVFFDNVWVASILPAIFIVVNYLSYRFDLIKPMERDADSSEKTLGTVYYAISLLVLTILSFGIWHKPVYGLVGVTIMGYGDGFAAIAGKAIKSKEFHIGGSTKSVAGSLTMFCISMIILSGALVYFSTPHWFVKSLLLSAVATFTEALSIKGTDNLTVPIIITLAVKLLV